MATLKQKKVNLTPELSKQVDEAVKASGLSQQDWLLDAVVQKLSGTTGNESSEIAAELKAMRKLVNALLESQASGFSKLEVLLQQGTKLVQPFSSKEGTSLVPDAVSLPPNKTIEVETLAQQLGIPVRKLEAKAKAAWKTGFDKWDGNYEVMQQLGEYLKASCRQNQEAWYPVSFRGQKWTNVCPLAEPEMPVVPVHEAVMPEPEPVPESPSVTTQQPTAKKSIGHAAMGLLLEPKLSKKQVSAMKDQVLTDADGNSWQFDGNSWHIQTAVQLQLI